MLLNMLLILFWISYELCYGPLVLSHTNLAGDRDDDDGGIFNGTMSSITN